MMRNHDQTPKWSLRKKITFFAVALAALGALSTLYVNLAFPRVRCEAVKHLESPDKAADCYTCHAKATPKTTQDWYESKHGVMLVKCFVCHGQPDGKGSIPFAVNPDVNTTCRKCHDPSVKRMVEKYGLNPACNDCHPFHNNSLHHDAYVKPPTKKTID